MYQEKFFTGRQVPEYPYRDVPTKFTRVVGTENCVWFVPNTGNADKIFCSNSDKSGYGGSTITFEMEDGCELHVVGPWHSNADALCADTGINLKDNSWTFGCISSKRDNGYAEYGISGKMTWIQHQDMEWTKGNFNRIENQARALALKNKREYYYYSASSGGASAGMIEWRAEAMREMIALLQKQNTAYRLSSIIKFEHYPFSKEAEILIKKYEHSQ